MHEPLGGKWLGGFTTEKTDSKAAQFLDHGRKKKKSAHSIC
jgi:hypothetical protein